MGTNLAYPIWVMQSDSETLSEMAEGTRDDDTKRTFIDRSKQCETAAKILELYAQHTAR